MLKLRIITAAILMPIFLWIIYSSDPYIFDVVLIFLILLCGWEWSNIAGLTKNIHKTGYIICLFGLMMILNICNNMLLLMFIFIVSGLWWLSNIYVLMLYQKKCILYFNNTILSLFIGIILLIPMYLGLDYLKQIQDSSDQHVILFLLSIVWAADTTAYFTGKYFGTTKLAVNISPGKTLQGLYGGLLGGFLVGILGLKLFNIHHFAAGWLILIGLLVTLMSIIGDLFESMCKRQKGIKDSGTFLPGHGGVLDRLDSLTAAAPMFTLFYILYDILYKIFS